MAERDRELERTMDFLAKGIIAGGSVGAIVGWFFMDFTRALFLGLLCGFFAGYTVKKIQDRRGRKGEIPDEEGRD